jgi:hypothetical protein
VDHKGVVVVSGLHPRVAVVRADAATRARVRSALAGRPGVRVVDTEAVAQRLEVERRQLDEAHASVISRHVARVEATAQARRSAAADTAQAVGALRSALADLDEFERLEAELADALGARDAATNAEALEATALGAVLARRARLAERRASAAQAIMELRASGPNRRTAASRQQMSEIERALARAEAEQAEAERRGEEAVERAKQARLAALAALEQADARIRESTPRATSAAWTPGPSLPGCLADHRLRLMAVLADSDAKAVAAREREDAAALNLQQEQHALARSRDASTAIDVSQVLAAWISERELLRDEVTTLVIDEAFASVDPTTRRALLEHLGAQLEQQTIYLSDDPDVLSWAIELPGHLGGVNAVVGRGDSLRFAPDANTAQQPALVD